MNRKSGAIGLPDDRADDALLRYSQEPPTQAVDFTGHALPDYGQSVGLATGGYTGANLQTGSVPASETITYAGSGLVFVNTYGSGVNDAYRSAIIQAENAFQSHFGNSVTLHLNFDMQSIDTRFSGENTFGNSLVRGISYATLNTALHNHATTADDIAAVNSLPATDPSGGRGFDIPIGMARILGLAPAGSGTDDSITLNSYYWVGSEANAVGVLEHEISEGAMGRISSLGYWDYYWAPMDLFRYSSVGHRDYTGGRDGLASYFSVDGNQLLTQFHNSVNAQGTFDNFDLADWEGTSGDAFGPGGPSSPSSMTQTDFRVMDVLGWSPLVADDFANSLTDTSHPFGSVSVNSSSSGTLEAVGDRDWFRVQLVAGVTYVINLQGSDAGAGTLADPYLRLHDASGNLLAESDDIVVGTNHDSQITYSVTASGTYYLDAGAYADLYTGTYRISVTAAVNHAPVVNLPSGGNLTASAVHQVFQFSTLFSGSDADNNPLTYFLYDDNTAADSGHWSVGGAIVPAQTIYQVSAAQLSQVTFVAGAGAGSDNVYVEAFDGQAYSGWSTFVHIGVAAGLDNAPTVSTPSGVNINAASASQSYQFSSLFSASDADLDPLTYFLYDATSSATSGHFVVNGAIVPAGTIYQVSAAQLAQTTFVAGTAGTADDIYAEAFDGIAYSGWNTRVHLTAGGVNHAPQVALPLGASLAASAGQTLSVANLFSPSDSDLDSLTYFLYDANPAANSGHFVVGGSVLPAQTIVPVSAAQLAQATFVAGSAGTSDDIYVEAYDGKAYSGWNTSVHVAVAGNNHAPTVSLPAGANANATAGQTLQLASLFSGSDIDGDALSYYVYDANAAANSGHFVVGGNTVAAQTITPMSAAQLATATFVAGAAGTSDDIYVEAYDGVNYSGWGSSVHVAVSGPANHAPTVSLVAGSTAHPTAGQSLQLSNLFSGSDVDGNALSYYVYDSNTAANSGHFVVGGNTVTAQTITPMSAAQLATATFVAGATGTADDIYVEAFDGQLYSGWNTSVHVFV